MNVFAIMNVSNPQHRVFCDEYSINVFNIVTVLMGQRRGFYANISMNISPILNVITPQLGTSCSFDSPGLARNEPTPGKHPQGDSMP